MPAPLAYFLTWTCYGTWLHGDDRHSVDDNHNQPGTPHLRPNHARVALDRALMRHPPFVLSDHARDLCTSTITAHAEIRRWTLRALNVRTNHVHLVVACPPEVKPETAMEQFKAWCTRRLREAGLAQSDRPVWTEHGSTRWINDNESLSKAVRYVTEHQ